MLALDSAALAGSRPEVTELVSAAFLPVYLARGDRDGPVTGASVRHLDHDYASIAAAGHTAMVDDPGANLAWLTGHPDQGVQTS